jgi:hypothetical protein
MGRWADQVPNVSGLTNAIDVIGYTHISAGRDRDSAELFRRVLQVPIRKPDVIAALNDPILSRINFSVGRIAVNASEFRNVAEYISAGDIKVSPGTGNVAFYDNHLNELTTQGGNPLLDFTDRAQILHECTHAIVDINGLDIPRLHGEVAAYLTQLTFMVISSPSPLRPAVLPRQVSPMARLIWTFKRVILDYNLHNARGFGAIIGDMDTMQLAQAVHALPLYAGVAEKARSAVADLGVPILHNQMRALKAALKRGHQPKHAPAPRITHAMIF